MVECLYRQFESCATSRIIAAGALLWMVSALGVRLLHERVIARSGGLAVPDVQPFYTPEELYALLEGYGETGRRAFLEFSFYDIFYPFVAYGFAALALSALSRSLVQNSPRWAWAILVPLLGLMGGAANFLKQPYAKYDSVNEMFGLPC